MTRDNRIAQWMKMEHYRLHAVEEWPESAHKQAVLAAIHFTMERLLGDLPAPFDPPGCMVCASRKGGSVVLQFPTRSQNAPGITRLAA